MSYFGTILGALVLSATLAACSSGSDFIAGAAPNTATPTERAVSNVVGKGALSGPTLYVLNSGGGNAYEIGIYSKGGASLLRSIDVGQFSDGFLVDSLGRLYVGHPATSNPNGEGLLDIYGSRGSKRIRTLHQTHAFGQLALDPSGNLFTLCASDRVSEYFQAKQHVLRRIALAKLGAGHTAMAVDGSGDLGVDTWAGPVLAFAPGATQPYWKISSGIYESAALAFDALGNLYAYTYTNNTPNVAVYAPGGTSPKRTISNGIRLSTALIFDDSGNLYALNYGAPESVTVYSPGSSVPKLTISSGLDNAQGLAVDSSGNVYIANAGASSSDHGSVTVYPSGSGSPSLTITHGVNKPIAVGVAP